MLYIRASSPRRIAEKNVKYLNELNFKLIKIIKYHLLQEFLVFLWHYDAHPGDASLMDVLRFS